MSNNCSNMDAPLKPPPLPILMTNQVPHTDNQPASSLGMGSIYSLSPFAGVESSQNNDALIEQLAQRQQTFSQLGSFMTAIQNEAQSVELWKTKLKELETLTNERQSLKKELSRVQEECTNLNKSNISFSNQLSQLKNEFALINSQLNSEKISKNELHVECDKLVQLVANLEEASKQGEREAKAAATLVVTNSELNEELVKMRNLLDRTNQDAARVVSEKQSRLLILEKEKNDLARHFGNVMEDVKGMKDALMTSQNQCSDLETRLNGYEKDNKTKDQHHQEIESSHLLKFKQLEEKSIELEQSRDKIEATLMLIRDQGVRGPEDVLALKSQIASLESNVATLRQDLSVRSEKLFQIESNLSETNEMKRSLEETNLSLEEQVESIRSELDRRREAASASREELNAALSECDGLRDHCDHLNDSLLQTSSKLTIISKQKDEIELKFSASNEIISNLELKLNDFENKMRNAIIEEQETMMRTVNAMKAAQTNEQRNFTELLEKEQQQSTMVQTLSDELEKRCNELSQLNHKLELKDQEMVELKTSLKEEEAALSSKERGMAASYNKERSRLIGEYEISMKKITSLETDKREALHDASTLRAALETSKQIEIDNKHVIKQLEKQVSSAQKAMEIAKNDRADVLSELKQLSVESSVKSTEVETELSSLREQIRSNEFELKSCKKQSIQQTSVLKEQFDALKQEYEIMKESNETLKKDKEKNDKDIKDLVGINDQLEAEKLKIQQEFSLLSDSLKDQEGEVELRLQRSEMKIQQMTIEIKELNQQKQNLSLTSRELSSSLRVSESKVLDIENKLTRCQLKLSESENTNADLSVRCDELEKEILSVRNEVHQYQHQYQDLERSCQDEIRKSRITIDKLKQDIIEAEDCADSIKEEKETIENKLHSIECSSSASIGRLENELRAMETSHRSDRERAQEDAEAWRKQMVQLEEEMETAANKAKANLTASRDESERQRKAAFEALNQCNEMKLKQESLRREQDAMVAELATTKDSLRDAEKRIASQKDALRAAGREAEVARVERDAASLAARRAEEEISESKRISFSGLNSDPQWENSHKFAITNEDFSSSSSTKQLVNRDQKVRSRERNPIVESRGDAALQGVDAEIAAHMAARAAMKNSQDDDEYDEDDKPSLRPSSLQFNNSTHQPAYNDSGGGTVKEFVDAPDSSASINATANFLANRRRRELALKASQQGTRENEEEEEEEEDNLSEGEKSNFGEEEEEEYSDEERYFAPTVESSLEELDPRSFMQSNENNHYSIQNKKEINMKKKKNSTNKKKVDKSQHPYEASVNQKKKKKPSSGGGSRFPTLPKGRSSRENSR